MSSATWAVFLFRMQCQTLTPFNTADMFAAHVTTFSVHFNWIKNERPGLKTELMKYPRYKDIFMDVVRFISLKCRNVLKFFLPCCRSGPIWNWSPGKQPGVILIDWIRNKNNSSVHPISAQSYPFIAEEKPQSVLDGSKGTAWRFGTLAFTVFQAEALLF